MLASLDDIAWLTNLRGNDIDHTPVFYSYMLVSMENAWLFAPVEKFSKEIRQSLEADGIWLKGYAELPRFLGEQKAGKVLLNADRINMLLGASIPAEWQIESEMDITTVYKTCKNETECRKDVYKRQLYDFEQDQSFQIDIGKEECSSFLSGRGEMGIALPCDVESEEGTQTVIYIREK